MFVKIVEEDGQYPPKLLEFTTSSENKMIVRLQRKKSIKANFGRTPLTYSSPLGKQCNCLTPVLEETDVRQEAPPSATALPVTPARA